MSDIWMNTIAAIVAFIVCYALYKCYDDKGEVLN